MRVGFIRLYLSVGTAALALGLVVSQRLPVAAELEAAPGLSITGVSGNLSAGNTVTISGSGFGTKPSGPPLKFDDFESGANGAAISSDWKKLGTTPKYSSAVKRPNSKMSVRAEFVNGQWLSAFGISGQPLPRIYFDAWYYLDATAPYSRNHKPFRIYTNRGDTNLYYGFWCSGLTASIIQSDNVSGNFKAWLSPTASYFGRKWVHLQAYFVESGGGVDNGTAEFWIDGVKHVSQVGNFRTRNSSSEYWSEIWFGDYLGHDADSQCGAYGDAYTYWDDVYVDTTPARVEIGDASTYANAKRREIQIPISWSNSTISIRFNPGAFSSTSGLYMFVVDSAGNVSPGYPLSGASTTMPSAPKNLRIVP